jgi:hypothetical protein
MTEINTGVTEAQSTEVGVNEPGSMDATALAIQAAGMRTGTEIHIREAEPEAGA